MVHGNGRGIPIACGTCVFGCSVEFIISKREHYWLLGLQLRDLVIFTHLRPLLSTIFIISMRIGIILRLSFVFNLIISRHCCEFNANCEDPDQTPRSAASDLGLHCLQMSFFGMLDIYGFLLGHINICWLCSSTRCWSWWLRLVHHWNEENTECYGKKSPNINIHVLPPPPPSSPYAHPQPIHPKGAYGICEQHRRRQVHWEK